ncbi:MAG: PD-(D/E)XK nuclease family protein [Myxococcales bacterium]|nr:PD-(D/E)XK nuclease family protein [Myxococcales bacterium]
MTTTDETRFQAQQVQERLSGHHTQDVEAWEHRLSDMLAEQARIVEAGDWTTGRADLLAVVGRARRETIHCAVLAWLLNPVGAHGLGGRFLAALLRHLSVDAPSGLARTRCQTEVVGELSRADLIVQAPDFLIVIEAKVDAIERPQQCADLRQDWQDDKGQVVFVFLTPTGRAPVTDDADAFVHLSFVEVRAMLEAEVDALGGRRTEGLPAVDTYLQTLRKEFR